MKLSEIRTSKFQRNILLESLLSDIGDTLQPAEDKLISSYIGTPASHPCILIMGPLRSGTTLFTQWLANSGVVAYPTNLLSRFYQAPIVGAKIQLLLTDPRFNFRDELGEFLSQVGYSSENGKTKGVLAPNEFWYFWRRFLSDPSRDVWTDEELQRTMDIKNLKAEIAGISDVFQKPFAAKGMLFNYNIPFLDSVLDKVLFVQIKRDPITNVASVLDARKRQLGSESTWYSFKIPEYESLKDLDAITQSAGQVYYINKAVDTGLSKVADTRKLVVNYEEFCRNPKLVYGKLLSRLNINSKESYCGPSKFEVSRDMSSLDASHIESVYRKFSEIKVL